ncbi:MAG: phosphotransferase, partial [Gemmataceae bacterium]|nr:phosphotransferase [Gemmataceae bacterium]
RRRLADALGRFLAALHEAGLSHHDLHPGNLLVRLDAAEQPHLFLIDLAAARFGPPLSWRRSMANLVLFNRWSILQTTRADRLRCFRAYWQARRSTQPRPAHAEQGRLGRDPSLRAMVRRLEVQTWASLHRFWKRRDRRCRGDNAYYRQVRSPSVVGHAVVDLDPRLVAWLRVDPDGPFRQAAVGVLKDSATSTVVELTVLVRGRPLRVVYKRFRVKHWTRPWRLLGRTPPALRCWYLGHGLRERCLPTPRPLLVLLRRRFGLVYEGYLLAEKIADASPLHECLTQLHQLPAAQRCRLLRLQIERVARAVRELHRRGLSQRDLKADNLLVAVSAAPPRPTYDRALPGHNWVPSELAGVWLVDLVGVTVHRRLSRRQRVGNLARLNASFHQRPELSRTDRLRFLRTYLEWGLRGKTGWKQLWRAVAAATQQKLRRNARRGRTVA